MFRCNRSTEFGPAGNRAGFLFWLALSLAGCQPQPAELDFPAGAGPSTLDETAYRTAADGGLPVYRLDPGASRIVCVVRREGPLARFGHDHVIGARSLDGLLLWAPESVGTSQGEIVVRVADLEVDPPDLRAEARLDTQPDDAAIAGTRQNLVNHVLRAGQWPEIRMRVALLERAGPTLRLAVDLTLNGVTRRLETDAQVVTSPGRLTAAGNLIVRQSEWGIEPFSVMGGGLRVADDVTVHYRFEAVRWPPAGS